MRIKLKSSQRIVALDGKSHFGVAWKINEAQIHILNAWDATENKFIGQFTIESKANEITAPPQMIKMLNLEKIAHGEHSQEL